MWSHHAQQPKYTVPRPPEVFQKPLNYKCLNILDIQRLVPMVSTLEGFTVYSSFSFPPLLPFSSSHHPCPFLLLSPTLPLVLSSPPPLPQYTVFEDPLRRLSEEEQEEMGLQYYDSDVHKASFTLPRFARKVDTLMVASSCTCYESPVTLNLNYY